MCVAEGTGSRAGRHVVEFIADEANREPVVELVAHPSTSSLVSMVEFDELLDIAVAALCDVSVSPRGKLLVDGCCSPPVEAPTVNGRRAGLS